MRAVIRDERERINSSSLQFWVTGTRPVWWGRPSNQIDLVADKDSYKPGDTAEVLVPIPFSGVSYVLMTVERAGIQQVEVFRVEGSTLVYQLPITEEHVPTIHVTATLMKGMDEENLNPLYPHRGDCAQRRAGQPAVDGDDHAVRDAGAAGRYRHARREDSRRARGASQRRSGRNRHRRGDPVARPPEHRPDG